MEITKNKIELISLKSDDLKSEHFAKDILYGLSKKQKTIPPLYFYDKKGSEIFENICDLDEYYQTRAETQILQKFSEKIAANSRSNTDIIELGSGSSVKTKILLDAFILKNGFADYFPIDISGKFLLESSQLLSESLPELNINPIAARYNAGLEYIFNKKLKSPKLVLWLGSSIGNLNKDESTSFLRNIYSIFKGNDRILIGMDLKKDRQILENAYDDSLNVTADFNLNLLSRINSELAGRFDLSKFKHIAIYNENKGGIEMHLVSLTVQDVFIGALNKTFYFEKDEYIHTENSYKYNFEDILNLAKGSGFKLINHWLDDRNLFSLNEFIKIK